MMRAHHPLLALAIAAGLTTLAPRAFADEDDVKKDQKDAEKAKKKRKSHFQFGVGVLGAVGGNFLDKPNNPGAYPGFGGANYGGGLMVDFRILKFIGIEADFLRQSDHGFGNVNLSGFKTDITIGQGAWHIPLLAKFVIPIPLVAPMFFAGPEFVLPSSAEGQADPPIPNYTIAATVDNYYMWTFGLGLEVKLPLPVIDIRIPFTLRGSFNPKVTDNLADRGTFTPTSSTFNSEWKFQGQATLGVGLYF